MTILTEEEKENQAKEILILSHLGVHQPKGLRREKNISIQIDILLKEETISECIDQEQIKEETIATQFEEALKKVEQTNKSIRENLGFNQTEEIIKGNETTEETINTENSQIGIRDEGEET